MTAFVIVSLVLTAMRLVGGIVMLVAHPDKPIEPTPPAARAFLTICRAGWVCWAIWLLARGA